MKNPVLEVEISVKKNLVIMNILHQDESLRCTLDYLAPNNITITSTRSPEINHNDDVIFLRGSCKRADDMLAVAMFGTQDEAKAYAYRMKSAFDELGKHLEKEQSLAKVIEYALMQNKNTVAFTIYDQMELPRKYCFVPPKDTGLLSIERVYCPDLENDIIYLRGDDEVMDTSFATKMFETEEEASKYIEKVKASLDYWVKHMDSTRSKAVIVNLKLDCG